MIRRWLSALLGFAQTKISPRLYRGSVAGCALLLLLQATAPAAEKIALAHATLVETFGPGNYTAIARGNGGAIGVGLVEVYNTP